MPHAARPNTRTWRNRADHAASCHLDAVVGIEENDVALPECAERRLEVLVAPPLIIGQEFIEGYRAWDQPHSPQWRTVRCGSGHFRRWSLSYSSGSYRRHFDGWSKYRRSPPSFPPSSAVRSQ
jgi:hypothetical protein